MRITPVAVSTAKGHFRALRKLQRKAAQWYERAIQALVDKYQVELATGHMDDIWQVRTAPGDYWQREDLGSTQHGRPKHPIFKDLVALDKVAAEFRIGPSNMERYTPKKV